MSNKIQKKSVEEWLNTVSYKHDPSYIPSEFALAFVSFIKSVNASTGGEENLTPIMHYHMLDSIAGSKKNIANLCHRGASKTSVMAEYLFLFIAVTGGIPGFGKINFALYVSDSIENGVKNMRKNLEHRWENSEFLQYYLPRSGMRLTDVRYQFTNLDGHKFVVRGYGAQALSLDSILYTKDGLTTMGEVKVGDKIYDPTGNLVKVKAKSEIFHKPMYRINLSDGRGIKVSEDHLNSVRFNQRINKILTTKELVESKLVRFKVNGNKSYNYHIVNTAPLNYSEKSLLLDPYTLGLLLGDGSIKSDGGVVLHAHKDDMEFYSKVIPYEFGVCYRDKRNNNVDSLTLKGLSQICRELGLAGISIDKKRIPEDYFYGAISQRIELVRGLIDTDGSISPEGKVTFTSTSKVLCDGLLRLVRSLGGYGKFFKGRLTKGNHRKCYKVGIWLNMNTAKLPRKENREEFNKSINVAIISIEPIDLEPSQCIAVESELREYLTDDYTRTHNTGVRGAKEMGKRPTLAIMDDLVSDEDARSATVISAIEDTVHKAVNFALHSTKSKRVWSGTPFNSRDPLYKVVESGAWYVNVYPVCEKFPCTEEEFSGSWEDRFNYAYVKEQYDTALALGQIDSFNQELMLRIMSDEDRLITDGDIGWYSVDNLLRARSNFNFYITTDFATNETTASDYSVISVWALNNNGDWFLVDAIVKRQLMDKNIDDLFRMCSRYKPQEVGIEVSGQQRGFLTWVKKEMLVRNIFFNLTKTGTREGVQPTTDKMTRFNVVVPWFKAGKMYFPKEAKDTQPLMEYMDELKLATVKGFKSKHDDCFPTNTPVITKEGIKNIVDVTINDYVLTRRGYRRVLKAWCKGYAKVITKYGITATPDHRIYTDNRGWVILVDLRGDDILIHSNSIGGTSCENQLPLITEHTIDIQKQNKVTIETTIPVMPSGKQPLDYCIGTSGSTITGKYQRDTISIIKTETQVITDPVTLSASHPANTKQSTGKRCKQKGEPQKDLHILQKLEVEQQNGTDLQKGEHGTENMLEKPYLKSYPKSSAQNVVLNSNQVQAEINYVLVSAKDYEEIGYYEKEKQKKEVPVYDLMVEEAHEFFAWGVLVHNCIDTISMLALLNSWKPSYSAPSVMGNKQASEPTAPDPWGMYGHTSDDTDYEEESPLSNYI